MAKYPWDKPLADEDYKKLGLPQPTFPWEESSEYSSLPDLVPDNSPSLSSFSLKEVVDPEVFDKKVLFQEKLEVN